jgi:hypothetical protein
MRPDQLNHRLFGVVAYLATVATVLIGAPYGLGLALSTVEQPSFLAPEYENPVVARNSTPAPEIPVVLKPYVTPTYPHASWGGSIARSYVARTKPAAQSKTATIDPKRKTKTQKRSKHHAKRKHNAMDAYASGPARGQY